MKTLAAWFFGGIILYIWVSLRATGSSQIQLVGSADPVIALAGDNVILPCYLKPNVSAVDMMVEWTRSDLKTQRVHLYREGRDSNGDQLPSYRGRTSLFIEELKNSNVSLKLTGVTLSDAGEYKCFIPTLTKQTTKILLIVGAVSQPVISINGTKDWGVVLKCDSGGWYPQPALDWLDSHGDVLSAAEPTETGNSTETEMNPEGRYTVRRYVTVWNTDNNRYTCRVVQLQINQTRETQIHVPDDIFPNVGRIVGLWIVGIILSAVAIVALVVLFYCYRKQRHKLKREAGKNLDLQTKLDTGERFEEE